MPMWLNITTRRSSKGYNHNFYKTLTSQICILIYIYMCMCNIIYIHIKYYINVWSQQVWSTCQRCESQVWLLQKPTCAAKHKLVFQPRKQHAIDTMAPRAIFCIEPITLKPLWHIACGKPFNIRSTEGGSDQQYTPTGQLAEFYVS